MNTGTTISGIGHVGLILWVMIGGLFMTPDEAPAPAVTEVSLVTGAEFAQLSAAAAANPPVLPQPSVQPVPEAGSEAVAQPAPDPPLETAPVPVVEPAPEPAVEPTPQPVPEPVVAPVVEPVPDPVPVAPASPRPKPRPAPRIAEVAAELPPADAQVAETVTPEVVPDQPTEQPVVEEPQPATAPQEAAIAVVPEDPLPEVTPPAASAEAATPPSAAPVTSAKPRSRPAKPAAPVETQTASTDTPSEPTPAAQGDAVAAALAEALAGETADSGADSTTAEAGPAGPPMTGSEKDGLRVAVQACWNVGALSSEALTVVVTIAVSMSPDGKPDNGSIKMVGFDGGTEAAATQAFETARRAIIRCGDKGFPLPSEKYEQWKNIEMVFDPKNMRIK